MRDTLELLANHLMTRYFNQEIDWFELCIGLANIRYAIEKKIPIL